VSTPSKSSQPLHQSRDVIEGGLIGVIAISEASMGISKSQAGMICFAGGKMQLPAQLEYGWSLQ
jgi:hypothetical protein